MCLFSFANTNTKSEAYKRGVTSFECGCCPECLAKRARQWSLRAAMEAKVSFSCMVTLTYDQYVRNSKGEIVGEKLVLRHVAKRDVQLFVKRLRKHFKNNTIKYLITAEYGKRTGRPHYHALLFGVDFSDRVFCKLSKRGNKIYRSQTLEKIWKNGICTVDAVNVSAKVARYCTKYCAKDGRSSDTFMLFSRGIGESELLRRFNGRSYWLDGREYPIPRQIWQKVITERYKAFEDFTYKYKNLSTSFLADFLENQRMRKQYRDIRNADDQYMKYIEYWREKGECYESTRPSELQRIALLPDSKYHSYKIKAKYAKLRRIKDDLPAEIPRFNGRSERARWFWDRFHVEIYPEKKLGEVICPLASRHERANDTIAGAPVFLVPIYDEFDPFDNPEYFQNLSMICDSK